MQVHTERQALDRTFHALADANRRTIVDQLARGPATVSELAEPLSIALPSVLKHLAVLEKGGIVLSEKVGRVRTYRITPDALSGLETWIAARKVALNRQFDRLERYLVETAGIPPKGKKR
jgi:DNA-binding transcriptional ArsR family regulator